MIRSRDGCLLHIFKHNLGRNLFLRHMTSPARPSKFLDVCSIVYILFTCRSVAVRNASKQIIQQTIKSIRSCRIRICCVHARKCHYQGHSQAAPQKQREELHVAREKDRWKLNDRATQVVALQGRYPLAVSATCVVNYCYLFKTGLQNWAKEVLLWRPLDWFFICFYIGNIASCKRRGNPMCVMCNVCCSVSIKNKVIVIAVNLNIYIILYNIYFKFNIYFYMYVCMNS